MAKNDDAAIFATLKRRPVRLRARTPPFHGGYTSSNLVRATKGLRMVRPFFYLRNLEGNNFIDTNESGVILKILMNITPSLPWRRNDTIRLINFPSENQAKLKCIRSFGSFFKFGNCHIVSKSNLKFSIA